MGSLPRQVALVVALVAASCGETLEPWDDPGTPEQFLGYDVMPELELRISRDAIRSLEREPRKYVRATIVFQGMEFGPVGLRLKGQGSFQPISKKPSFRINVDEYIDGVTFYGLKDMTFNNMVSDPSQMHERIAYLVAREVGLPASRANHLLLTVNGEFYGVYSNVETVKHRMIGGWFDNNDGPLFEATDVDFADPYLGAYELKAGPDDRSLLYGLAGALMRVSADEAIAAASQYIDIGHFQRYWAMSTLIGQFDAFPFSIPGDDYFLYADPTSQKLWFIPWGMDETFFAADFSPLQIHSVLARRCMESQPCFQGYVNLSWQLLAEMEAFGLEAERVRVQQAIAPHVARDTRKPFTAEQVAEGQLQHGFFIRGRREILTGFLPPPTP